MTTEVSGAFSDDLGALLAGFEHIFRQHEKE
jgi:hypothetical protein